MFATEYYCLVAGLKEYSLDADTKGFDATSHRRGDSRRRFGFAMRAQVRLLYGYYDCENIASLRAGRSAHNPLGNFTREELEEEVKAPKRLPVRRGPRAARPMPIPKGRTPRRSIPRSVSKPALFDAYYATVQPCREPLPARVVGFRPHPAQRDGRRDGPCRGPSGRGGDAWAAATWPNSWSAVSAADFGLRGELPYIDAVIAAVNDEANLVEKEHKIDLIRWNEATELATFDYFDINTVLSYLARVNIVARWTQLDAVRGREMFDRLMAELDGRELVNRI